MRTDIWFGDIDELGEYSDVDEWSDAEWAAWIDLFENDKLPYEPGLSEEIPLRELWEEDYDGPA